MSGIYKKTFEQYYSELYERLQLKILEEADNFIIVTPTEDLVKYYTSDLFEPLEVDQFTLETLEHKKYIKTIPARQREWAYQSQGDLKMECEEVIVKLPIIPNKHINKILDLRTNTISFTGDNDFIHYGNQIHIIIETLGYGFKLENEQIVREISNRKDAIINKLLSINSEISAENIRLDRNLTLFIDQRKRKLDEDNTRISNLLKLVNIPLARKADEVVKKVQLSQKPFVQRIRPETPKVDYQLDRTRVLDIIRLVDNQCRQFEKTPRTYDQFNEPNLRDQILSNLNSIFEGAATGETFNNKGKTDIYLNIDRGNILVCECKFYGGQKLYHETIDQLLGYLTWRHNYGIMISFCKQKNFSKILTDAPSIINSHPTFEKDYSKIGDAHFISKNTLPGDDYKYVEIHHLYYNLYTS